MKGLRVDLRGAAGRPWVPKREGPREDEAAAGHELCEFEEAGCRPRGGDAGGAGAGGGRAGRRGLVWKVRRRRLRTPRELGAHAPPPHQLCAGLPLGAPGPRPKF